MREPRIRTFRSLADVIPALSQAALGDGGTVKARLFTQWTSIVGNELAGKATPREVSFSRTEPPVGTLYLEVVGGYATELQMSESIIVEKIAVYFGYRAIARIKLQQAPKG